MYSIYLSWISYSSMWMETSFKNQQALRKSIIWTSEGGGGEFYVRGISSIWFYVTTVSNTHHCDIICVAEKVLLCLDHLVKHLLFWLSAGPLSTVGSLCRVRVGMVGILYSSIQYHVFLTLVVVPLLSAIMDFGWWRYKTLEWVCTTHCKCHAT